MPICFTLTRKDQTEPESLNKIDEEICALLKREVNPKRYAFTWYDVVGVSLAFGKTWEEIRDAIKEYNMREELLKIVDYLEENYVPNSWRASK